MEFKLLNADDAEDISSYLHDMWVDTYAPIVMGGRQRAEQIFPDWAGPDRVRKDMEAGFFFAFAMVDGEPVGLVSAGKTDEGLWISKLYVAPGHRGSGYGSQCFDHIIDYGRKNGCICARLEVNPRNETAISFYEHHGMRIVGKKFYEDRYTALMEMEL